MIADQPTSGRTFRKTGMERFPCQTDFSEKVNCLLVHVVAFWLTYLCNEVSTLNVTTFDNEFAEKGLDFRIMCRLELVPPWEDNVLVLKSLSDNITVMDQWTRLALCSCCTSHDIEHYYGTEQYDSATCYYIFNENKDRYYNITSDRKNVYISITAVDRTKDQMYWTCIYVDTSLTTTQIYLSVYTSPTAAILDSSIPDSNYTYSLSDSGVNFTCRTDTCTYKDPIFQWFVIMENGSRLAFEQGETHTWQTVASCGDSEMIYNSRIIVQGNMTFANNSDQSVRFICSITMPTLKEELFSNPSGKIDFAVTTTSVHLYDGHLVLGDKDTISVLENVSHSVMCKAGTSRPPPIYVFYIDEIEVKGSVDNTMTFLPNRQHHNKTIFCKAYNLQGKENAIVSQKPNLYVQIPVNAVILRDGETLLSLDNLIRMTVTDEQQIALVCQSLPLESMPLPYFSWYIGDQLKQNSTSSRFTFTPETKLNDLEVYCSAINVPGVQSVESSKARLSVIGRPVQPQRFLFIGSSGGHATFYWIASYNGGYKQSFVLQYRKAGDKEWFHYTLRTEKENEDKGADLLPDYTASLSDLAPGEYQARLISRNKIGEASPLDMTGTTFSIDAPESSTAAVVTGVVLGVVILSLAAVVVYLLILLKRKKPANVQRRDINLEVVASMPRQVAPTYEHLQAADSTTGTTYDSVEISNMNDSQTIDYENPAPH